MDRNVEIITDSDKKKIVRIHDIRLKGKRPVTIVFGKSGQCCSGIPQMEKVFV